MVANPSPELYEKMLEYMPHKASLSKVIEYVNVNAPKNGQVLDLMCGPGYLLGQVNEKRIDLTLIGVDINEKYINYANNKYHGISFLRGNVLKWETPEKFDMVLCTGALHHLPYKRQEKLIEKVSRFIKSYGTGIITDCYIEDYGSELDRKLGAAKLGYDYLQEGIMNRAPIDVIIELIAILQNDVLKKEFKTSMEKRLPIFNKYFKYVTNIKTWPLEYTDFDYGDYITFLRNSPES